MNATPETHSRNLTRRSFLSRSGAGIGSYTFIWAMAGDNVDYTDMDFIQPGDLK